MARTRVQRLCLHSHSASRRFDVSQGRLVCCRRCRIDEYNNTSNAGHEFAQKFEPFCHHLSRKPVNSRQAGTRPRKARDKTQPDWVLGDEKDNRDCRGCRLSRERGRRTDRGNRDDRTPNQFGRQRRQPTDFIVSPTIFDRDVLAFDEARLFQALAECAYPIRIAVGRCGVEKPNHRHCRLLRARGCGAVSYTHLTLPTNREV